MFRAVDIDLADPELLQELRFRVIIPATELVEPFQVHVDLAGDGDGAADGEAFGVSEINLHLGIGGRTEGGLRLDGHVWVLVVEQAVHGIQVLTLAPAVDGRAGRLDQVGAFTETGNGVTEHP